VSTSLKAFAYLVFATLVLGIGGIVYSIRSRPSVTSLVGTPVPRLDVATRETPLRLDTLTGSPLVVVIYSPRCDHCHRQLDAFARSTMPVGARLLLVSIADLPLDSLADIWPALRASSAVTWAQASWPAVKSQFHIRAVPTVLVYDRNRRLAKGFVGEVRVDSVYALATK